MALRIEDATSEKCGALAAIGQALSDPIRVEMLGMMAEGRACCELPDLGAPVDTAPADDPGICVCEFMEYFEMGQSRVSYHLRKLREAGLVREERRGKWSFYSLDREAVRRALALLAGHLNVQVEKPVDIAH